MHNIYSQPLQVIDISSFLCTLQKNMLRFPFNLLEMSVQIIIIIIIIVDFFMVIIIIIN